MAFIQRMKIPEPINKEFKLSEFSGGLNNVTSSFELKINESPDLLNVICFEPGSIETRPGTFKYLTEQFASTIKKVFIYETTSVSKFLLCTDTKLYVINTTGGIITELLTVSNVISGFQYGDKFYFVDGAKYREYDGTNIYEIINCTYATGIAQAGAPTTITLPTTFSANNDYYNNWEIHIYSGTGDGQTRTISDYDGATKVATVSSNWATNPDSTSAFYITNATQGELKTDSVSSPKTKMYVPTYQEFADSFKGPNNLTDMVKCKQGIEHKTKSRAFFAINSSYPNVIYSTDIDNMYYIPTNQFQPAISNDGDIITGIYSFNSILIVFKKYSIYALYGYDETDYSFKEVTVASGTSSINSVSKADNNLVFLGSNGVVYSLTDVRTDYQKILTKPISESLNLNKYPINLYDTDYENAIAIFFDKYYILSINDKTLVYTNGSWMLWDNLNPTCFVVYDNSLLFTNSNKYLYRLPFQPFYITETFTATAGQTNFTVSKGYINEAGNDALVYVDAVPILTDSEKVSNTEFKIPACTAGQTVKIEYLSSLCYNDSGDAYESRWESKDIDFGYPSKIKQIRKMWVTANTYKYFLSKVHFDAYIDYSETNTDFTMTNQISLWGASVFGSRFINKNTVDSTPIQINKRGRIIRFKLWNDQIDQPFRLYNIYGEVNVKK